MAKTCHKCKKEKTISGFYKNKANKDNLDCYCIDCRKKSSRISGKKYLKTKKGKAKRAKYIKDHQQSENYKNSKKKYYQSVKGKLTAKCRVLKYLYNITIKQHRQLYDKQKGICAICKKHIDYKDVHTDHNHKTNEVRGLLCMNCNLLIGHADDDVCVLKNAIKYLEKCN